MNQGQPRHILLSSAGISGPKKTSYVRSIGDTPTESNFSSFGIWKLLPAEQRPDEIWFLLTPQAIDKTWNAIQSEGESLNVSVRKIEIVGDADDTQDFLERAATEIPEGCWVTLNVTEGLRHHAFLFYALALYLTSFRDVRINGVWYCRLETEVTSDPKPLIDLKPILDLSRWFHALLVFQEAGTLREVSKILPAGEVQDLVEKLSFFFQNGMPIEAGNEAARLLTATASSPLVKQVPLAVPLNDWIKEQIECLAGASFEIGTQQNEHLKANVRLTPDELQRQASFIDRYFKTDQLNLAFGLMREWVVNWVADETSLNLKWLDRDNRLTIEHSLGGLDQVFRAKDPKDPKRQKNLHASVREQLSDEQRDWAKRWGRICDIRNALQHHGMKVAPFVPDRSDINQCKDDWQARTGWKPLPRFGGGYGRLLVCSIGHTPGVLYSACAHTNPQRLLVICSKDSAPAIEEAILQFGREVEKQHLTLDDPYVGIDEFDQLMQQSAKWLTDSDEMHACLTGGTSLMGVLVSRLVQRASREFQRGVREFVLIDKRPNEAQRIDPWKLGEIHYLDGTLESNDDTTT